MVQAHMCDVLTVPTHNACDSAPWDSEERGALQVSRRIILTPHLNICWSIEDHFLIF